MFDETKVVLPITANMIKKYFKYLLNKFGYTLLTKENFEKNYIFKSNFIFHEIIISKYLHQDFFFVQIGANDGKRYDPINAIVKRERLKGLAIEPIPSIFEDLKITYRDYPTVKVLNVAIHKNLKKAAIYRVDMSTKKYPQWCHGTASFNKEHHKKSNIPDEDIIEEWVDCISFEELFNNYCNRKIDLLQIDTEGYDFEIIKTIDFTRVKPTIISFEHGMAQGIQTPQHFKEIFDILHNEGYNFIVLENDAIAFIP
jgi:FkbM family methyltransferase